MSVAVTAAGADAVAARLEALPAALGARLVPIFAGIGAALYARVVANLSGAVVNAGSGRLMSAIAAESGDASARVTLDPEIAPYGAALEFGASIPAQLIAAKNAKALAFVVGGRQVFAKHVMHRAFALPPHSFLRSALADLEPGIVAAIEEAVAEAVVP